MLDPQKTVENEPREKPHGRSPEVVPPDECAQRSPVLRGGRDATRESADGEDQLQRRRCYKNDVVVETERGDDESEGASRKKCSYENQARAHDMPPLVGPM